MEDLPQLLTSFLVRLNREFQKSIQAVHPLVVQSLAQYSWPGNVRELENLMERAYILENSSVLTPDGFPVELFEQPPVAAVLPLQTQLPLAEARKIVLIDFERRYIKDLLSRNVGKINRSAEEAGISTRQLHKLMHQYGISKEEYKPKG